jgi:hypothetical protein
VVDFPARLSQHTPTGVFQVRLTLFITRYLVFAAMIGLPTFSPPDSPSKQAAIHAEEGKEES